MLSKVLKRSMYGMVSEINLIFFDLDDFKIFRVPGYTMFGIIIDSNAVAALFLEYFQETIIRVWMCQVKSFL